MIFFHSGHYISLLEETTYYSNKFLHGLWRIHDIQCKAGIKHVLENICSFVHFL